MTAPPVSPRKITARTIIGSVMFLLLLAALVGGAMLWHTRSQANIAHAAVGDCAYYDQAAKKPTYHRTKCSDARATLSVLAVVDSRTKCVNTPGVSSYAAIDDRFTCFGKKGSNPKTSINTITQGECTSTDGTQRVSCTDSGHRTVLLVLSGIARAPSSSGNQTNTADECIAKGASNTAFAYSWAIEQVGSQATAAWDHTLCLSAVGAS